MPEQFPVVILISGGGSNLQAIINASQTGELPIDIRAVISNVTEAHGLVRAQEAGIATEVIKHTDFANREDFDSALQTTIDNHQPKLVILAGFMRLLSDDFVNHYLGRMINIHPSLLPDFKGLNTHERVLEARQADSLKEHGASVHFVTPDLDGGPVILQATVPVNDDDTIESLSTRVLIREHQIYPVVIRWFTENRLSLKDHQVFFDGQALKQALSFDDLAP
jgi:phosphoribosylglycinamide formyltransferase-1